MNKRTYAKQLLTHYFRLAFAESGADLEYDCISEMDGIVDNIIDAAVEESTSIMIKYFQREVEKE